MAARALAARLLLEVMEGASLSRVMPRIDGHGESALIQELVYGCLRWHFKLTGILDQLLDKPLRNKDRDIECLLRVGLYQLMEMRIPEHAALNETVRETRTMKKAWARGLVNGVMRQYQRQHQEVLDRLDTAAALSHPVWLVNELQKVYPEQWRLVCEANNQRPPMTLRVNECHQSVDQYLETLKKAGIEARRHECAPQALILNRPCDVSSLPGFFEGWVSVQDAAAQLAAHFLNIEPEMRILDACAAPGGKTAHILEQGESVEVWAVEKDGQRIPRLEQTLSRLGLSARVVHADAAEVDVWWDGRPFDRILLDAPCSATGVIRRHPDIRLHRRPEDIQQLREEQQRLLGALWPLLRSGGMLLYATCSVLPQENVEQISWFVDDREDASEIPLDMVCGEKQAFGRQILPGDHGMDGFYYAGLLKR